jgi:hypothetical protein
VLRRQMRGWGEGPSRKNIRDANDAFEGLKVGRLGRIEGSLRLTISSGRQRRRGVSHLRCLGFLRYDSQPLRAGLNCGAPTALCTDGEWSHFGTFRRGSP